MIFAEFAARMEHVGSQLAPVLVRLDNGPNGEVRTVRVRRVLRLEGTLDACGQYDPNGTERGPVVLLEAW